MLRRSAEDSFARGMEALSNGRRREALALFEAAIEIEKRNGAFCPQARYLSFYGLCLALEKKSLRDGIRFCQQAVNMEFYNPDLGYNLGWLLLKAGRRKEAYRVLIRERRLHPGHRGIREELKRMGRRRRRVLPFLSRRNPVNVWLGRIAHPASVPSRKRH